MNTCSWSVSVPSWCSSWHRTPNSPCRSRQWLGAVSGGPANRSTATHVLFLYSFCNKITAQQMKMLILAYFVFIQVHKWNRFSHFLVVGMLGCSGALAKLGVWFQPFMLSTWVTVQKSQIPPGPLQLQELKLSQVRGNPGPKHWHAFTPLISNTPTPKNHLQFKWI